VHRSTNRFLTTHVGSLPRPDNLLAMMVDREEGREVDAVAFSSRVSCAVDEIVDKQVNLGIDVINDGEQGKVSFVTYVNERLSGIVAGEPRGNLWKNTREGQAFPEFYAEVESHASGAPGRARQMICVDRLRYSGRALLEKQLKEFKAAADRAGVVEAFVPSISPANVERWQRNEFYTNNDEYLEAIAEAMREEYEAIVAAGFLLQVDDPAMATRYTMTTDSIETTRNWANVRVDVLNTRCAICRRTRCASIPATASIWDRARPTWS
jgi:5-methyltetrahydropteroyltriglutamate--homocysteine methyltransferase